MGNANTERLVSADYESADLVRATFDPERAVDLPQLVGRTGEWMVLWRGGSGTTFGAELRRRAGDRR